MVGVIASGIALLAILGTVAWLSVGHLIDGELDIDWGDEIED